MAVGAVGNSGAVVAVARAFFRRQSVFPHLARTGVDQLPVKLGDDLRFVQAVGL
jgi:hypothetical protein